MNTNLKIKKLDRHPNRFVNNVRSDKNKPKKSKNKHSKKETNGNPYLNK